MKKKQKNQAKKIATRLTEFYGFYASSRHKEQVTGFR